jgi:hypothetical protein
MRQFHDTLMTATARRVHRRKLLICLGSLRRALVRTFLKQISETIACTSP